MKRKVLILLFIGILICTISYAQWGGHGAFGTFINFLRKVTTSIIPSADDTYSLGSSTKLWKAIYGLSIYLLGTEYLTWDTTRTDFVLSDDLIIEDIHPGIYTLSTDSDIGWGWHYHVNATYPYALWRVTDDGTGALVNPNMPAIWVEDDTTPRVSFPYGIGNDLNNLPIDTDTLYVDTLNDRIGIGTASPGSLLHINSTAVDNTTLLTLESDISNNNEYNEILFKIAGGANYGAIRSCVGAVGGNSYMSFHTTTDGGTTLVRQMTIQHDGKVGIGDYTPSYRLDVNGTFRVVGAVTLDSTLGCGAITSSGTVEGTTLTEGGAAVPITTEIPGMTSTTPEIIMAFHINDPDADEHDDIKIKFERGVTLTAVHAICVGGTNVIGRLYEVDSDGIDSDKVGMDNSDWTIGTTAFSETSFDNTAIDDNDWLQWDTTTVTGSVDNVSITVWGYET